MSLLDDKVKQQLTGIFQQMKDKINIVYFTQEFECNACKDTSEFLDEVTALSENIHYTKYDFQNNKEEAEKLGIEKIPAIAVNDKDNNDTGIRFFGLPGGYEINSFISSILEVSGKKEPLSDDLMSRISKIKKNIHIQVLVTLSCPYCPAAVSAAHRIALENSNVRADMIDSALFPPLVQKYDVTGVPKIVINEKLFLEGAHPIESLLDEIEKL